MYCPLSCSLLHVPYTLQHEQKLSEEYKAYFAYAEEKLVELQELSALAESADYTVESTFVKNKTLFLQHRDCENEEVTKRLAGVKETDYTRLPERVERQKLQKTVLGLPEFPTTTIGSFPQTKDVKANRSAFRRGEITKQQYIAFNQQKIAECVKWQEEIGLDVLVHGEYERNDMVEYFGEGVRWIFVYRKSMGTVLWNALRKTTGHLGRCISQKSDHGRVVCLCSVSYEKDHEGMLTGPVTILNWSFLREDISIKESISQIALAIRDEVLDLEANGIQMIQIDEAALREKLPLRHSDWYTEYLDFAIPAFRLTHSGVKPETQIHTHMCYSEFTDIISAIDDMDADVITFEASRSDLQILDSLKENHFETEVAFRCV